jgi:hypothetical protein
MHLAPLLILPERGFSTDFKSTADLNRSSDCREQPQTVSMGLFVVRQSIICTCEFEFRQAQGNHADALTALKLARELAIWFHQTYGKKSQFKPVALSPPREPVDDSLFDRVAYKVTWHRFGDVTSTEVGG